MTTILVASPDVKLRGHVHRLLTSGGPSFTTASFIEAANARETLVALTAHTLQLAIVDDGLTDKPVNWSEDLRSASKRTPMIVLLPEGSPPPASGITTLRSPSELSSLAAEAQKLLPAQTGPVDIAAQIEESFRALRRDYLASLPGRLQSIRDAIAKARSSGDVPSAESARNVFHQLKGTGSSFGMPELTDAAGRGETALIRFKADPTADVWGEVERALADMEALVAAGA
jgi:HPt (histidine-containing phosphotransfer) domain-containing protein